jgi:hypothetical protein
MILTQSLLTELATRVSFDKMGLHLPVTRSGNLELFAHYLAKGHESTSEEPRTLIMKMLK